VTAALEERVTRLEAKVERLETWAGLGQDASFSESLAGLRKKFDDFGRVQALHTKMISDLADDLASLEAGFNSDVATLKTDAAGLKGDMGEVKGTLGEILDRLPPRRE
jgi:hypothetical protein